MITIAIEQALHQRTVQPQDSQLQEQIKARLVHPVRQIVIRWDNLRIVQDIVLFHQLASC